MIIDPVQAASNPYGCSSAACDLTTIELNCDYGGCNYKWSDVVLAGDGKLYFIPFSTEAALIVDPTTGISDQASISSPGVSAMAGSNKWSGGVQCDRNY